MLNDQLINNITAINPSMYIQSLFDPVQTHAVYSVLPELVDTVKETLRQSGATRFRIVKARSGNVIICFKLNSN